LNYARRASELWLIHKQASKQASIHTYMHTYRHRFDTESSAEFDPREQLEYNESDEVPKGQRGGVKDRQDVMFSQKSLDPSRVAAAGD
jgi:hypothetical protein